MNNAMAGTIDDELIKHAAEVGKARSELLIREAEIQAQTTGVVKSLGERGFSVRDIARLLEITPGRVSQLANA